MSAEVASKCSGCVVTKRVNPASERTLCQYDGVDGAKHEPSVDENGPVGGWLLINPDVPLVLLTGPNECGDEDSDGGDDGSGGNGGPGEGGSGGTGEGGSGGAGGDETGGTGGSETGGSGGEGSGGTGEGGSGGGDTGGSGANVTEVPNPETAGDGAANP
ncbi:hypothetical protein [Nocardia cyriacigeorgica]|uniref:hypothetical protein n=1 Tax=Nocardia cyriacigeorgica TaxID=135487 RepID=UPI0013EF2904|nr:hypothetical protein [Nocardia cyriacigeorgica]